MNVEKSSVVAVRSDEAGNAICAVIHASRSPRRLPVSASISDFVGPKVACVKKRAASAAVKGASGRAGGADGAAKASVALCWMKLPRSSPEG